MENLSIGMIVLNLPEIVTKSEIDEYFELIASNVKRIRIEKGMSQLEVALSIGQKSSGFYANAENYAHGKKFNLEHLLRLSKLFNVDTIDFFTNINKQPKIITSNLFFRE